MRKLILRYFAIAVFVLILFNLALFLITMPFQSDEMKGPSLLPALIFAFLMGLIVYFLVRWLKPKSLKEALSYSFTWAAFVFLAILAITIPNETTEIFFGSWFNYFSFFAMAISPIFLKLSKNN